MDMVVNHKIGAKLPQAITGPAPPDVAHPARLLARLEHEVEARHGAVAGHEEVWTEQSIALVLRLVREVELRRQDRARRRLDADMEMAGSPGVETGHDGLQLIASGIVGKLMAAQSIAVIVVGTGVVGVPEIEQRTSDRPAIPGQHEAGEHEGRAGDAPLAKRRALGRVRREERACRLAGRWIVAIVAGRGERRLIGRGRTASVRLGDCRCRDQEPSLEDSPPRRAGPHPVPHGRVSAGFRGRLSR
jgi:hypothetical protein